MSSVMKRALCLLISFSIFFSPFIQVIEAETNDRVDVVNPVEVDESETDRVIVKLDSGLEAESLDEYEVVENQIGEDFMTVEVPEHQSTVDFIEDLEERKDVVYAEPDHLIQLSHRPSDPYYSTQWHHQAIQTETAWNKSKGSDEVVVAVIDNGIDLNHPDLRDRIVSPYDVVLGTSNTINPGEHGTHVAGIIASSIDNGYGGSGVAPHARIMPINVFKGEAAYTSDVIKGIYYAIESGAEIINMSLGTYDYSFSLDLAIQHAYQSGLVIIAAAGNDSTNRRNYPSSFENVISVSSTTASDAVSSFSNYGFDIDIAAPGSHIYSTLSDGAYGYMSGTSMAAPVVSGVAALIWSNERKLSNKEIANRMFETADDLGQKGKDVYYGYGRVNASHALRVKDIKQPDIHEVTDYDKNVTGSILDDIGTGTVEVRKDRSVLGSTSVSSYSSFTVPIPKQPAGTILNVVAIDSNGNSSKPVQIKATDRTPPVAPKVNEVRTTSKWITGQAESGTKIEVKVTSTLIGTGQTKADGSFELSIPAQNAATQLSIVAIDQAGNVSPSQSMTVLDKTAPAMPTVNVVSDQSKGVTGKTEPGAVVTITIGSKRYSAKADSKGNYKVAIPVQKASKKLTVTAKDNAGNVSKGKTVTVLDKTAPSAPKVTTAIKGTTKEVKGTAERYSTITIKAGKKVIGTGKANSKGDFKVKIKAQKKKTNLTITATDQAKNISKATNRKVN